MMSSGVTPPSSQTHTLRGDMIGDMIGDTLRFLCSPRFPGTRSSPIDERLAFTPSKEYVRCILRYRVLGNQRRITPRRAHAHKRYSSVESCPGAR